jgi:hypothetical protein
LALDELLERDRFPATSTDEADSLVGDVKGAKVYLLKSIDANRLPRQDAAGSAGIKECTPAAFKYHTKEFTFIKDHLAAQTKGTKSSRLDLFKQDSKPRYISFSLFFGLCFPLFTLLISLSLDTGWMGKAPEKCH